jgi:methyl-accepting chemotaxis protein
MFKWLLNMKLRGKLLLFSISILIVSMSVVIIFIQIIVKKQIQIELQNYRISETNKIKNSLKNYINVVVSSVIEGKINQYKKNKISLEEAKKLTLEELKTMRYDEGTGYIWINDMGVPFPKMIMHPTVPKLDGIILDNQKYNCAFGKKKNLFQAFVDVCREKEEGFVDYLWPKPTVNGLTKEQPKISYVQIFKEWDWVIGTGVYVDSIDKEIAIRKKTLKNQKNKLLRVIMLICIVVAVTMIFLIYFYSGFILRPMQVMKEIVDNVSHGDLTREIKIKTKDEIGEMSIHFNSLINDFRNLLLRTGETTGVLVRSIQDLKVSSSEVSASSNQQAAAVKEIIATMEDSDKLSKNIALKINEVSRISNKTKEYVENGFSLIKNSMDKMGEIKETNDGMINGIKSFVESVASIWDVVKTITGIADQTKIIAFNAELEASAAGDAGKNFLIVASEVRRLADVTVTSTNEIKVKINEIQRFSDSLVLSSEEGTGKIKEGWELSKKQRELFEKILHSSEISASSASQIVFSVEQQVVAFEQILITLKQISEGIDNFVTSTSTTSRASDDLHEISDDLNEILSRYIIKKNKELITID